MNAQAKILLADNDPDFLETRREFLEREGYEVSIASSPMEVQNLMKHGDANIAILDIRLLNDDDEKDISGLELAKTISRSLPVIILTGYPAVEYATQALKTQVDGYRAAVDFVLKEQGPEVLVTAVKHAFLIGKSQDATGGKEKEKSILINSWKPLAAMIAMVAMLLALGMGVEAIVSGNPNWLFGTLALAIISVAFAGISIN